MPSGNEGYLGWTGDGGVPRRVAPWLEDRFESWELLSGMFSTQPYMENLTKYPRYLAASGHQKDKPAWGDSW